MLTDLALRNLKPRATLYKVTDRDGMQEWADMVDAWTDARGHVPKLLPENSVSPAHVGGDRDWRS